MLPQGRYCAFAGTKKDLGPKGKSRFSPGGKWLWINVNGTGKILDDHSNEIPIHRISWICFNPFKAGSHRKSKGNILERRAITIEYDQYTLAEQRKRLKDVPYTVRCYSGGKSIHAHIIFTRPLSDDESAEIDGYLKALFGDSDKSTWRINQLVRMPGGFNYDTEKEQVIEDTKHPVEPSHFLLWLRSQAELKQVEPAEIAPSVEPKPENKTLFSFKEWLLDQELCKKRGFQKRVDSYEGVSGVGYWSHCPQANKHTGGKTTSNEFNVFLCITGEIKKKCFHNSCHEIWKATLESLLGFRVTTAANVDAWLESESFAKLGIKKSEAKAAIFHSHQAAIDITEQIEPVVLPEDIREQATIKEILAEIASLQDRQYLLFSAPTGIGKTYTIAQAAIAIATTGLPVTIITDSITSAKDAAGKIKGMLTDDKITLSLNVSGITADSDTDNNKADIQEGIGQIAVTTYGYLGRKGHKGKIYKLAEKLVNGRTTFCDEIGELYKHMQILEPLAARYLKRRNTLRRVAKCPAFVGTGSCRSCFMAYQRKDPESLTNERKFYYDIPHEKLSFFTKKDDLGILPSDIYNPATYTQIEKTFFARQLPEKRHDQITETKEDSFIEYISHVYSYLLNPHLRMNCPIETQSKAQVKPEMIISKDGYGFPAAVCQIPYLAGIDTLPLLQLLQSKRLILTSATIPKPFEKIMREIAISQKWSGQYIQVPDLPFQFNLTQLNTQKRLSADRIVKAIEKLSERPEKSLIVAAKKREAEEVCELASKRNLNLALFIERRYREIKESFDINQRIPQHILTYARSAITRFHDMAELQILICDCQHMLPRLALSVPVNGDMKAAMHDELNDNLLQITGRGLRSKLDRIEGQTVIDERPIATIFHTLPEGFTPQLDTRLFYQHTVIDDTWLPATNKGEIIAIVDAINAVLDGREVPDKRKLEAKKLAKKASKTLSPKQRALSKDDREKAKAKKKRKDQKAKIKKARKLLLDGYTEREVTKNLNLHRLTTEKQKEFWLEVITDDKAES